MEDQERLTKALADRYHIEREIGGGGMATVYLAEDLKHDRKVAVKVLKPELAAAMGPERFLAEIRTTANLSHPHILPLHDSGEANGFLFYVMPLVEGESLRQRLDRDTQLPVGEAVRIVGHVAEALDYAHRHGVIHRDIKPANILFQEQDPVVTDFGISLAVSTAGEGRLTETGLSLGSPYYMSPEQAAGDQTAAAASDVYSLGCVLYEMLTGDPPHTGSSSQAILGKILLGEVTRPTKLRRSIPAHVEGVILKALEHIPADRFESAADMTAALDDKSFRHGVGADAISGPGPWKRMAFGLAVVAGVLAAAFAWSLLSPPQENSVVVRFRVPLQQDQLFAAATGVDVALSPDGSRIVYVGIGGAGGVRLWQRPLAEFEPSPMLGTESPSNPVVSPDGLSVAFITQGALKTVSFDGGKPFTVLPGGVLANGLDWGPDSLLYFSNEDGVIQRVPATGGQPETMTFPEPLERHTAVDVLPGGKGLLLTVNHGQAGRSRTIGVAPPGGGQVRTLFEGTMARYLPPGYVVFSNGPGLLWAVEFDLARLEATSPPVLLLSGVAGLSVNFSEFALSETGNLVYRTVPMNSSGDIVWVSRQGLVEEIDPDWSGDFRNPSLSPDGKKLALDRVEGTIGLWIRDMDRGSRTLLRTDPAGMHSPTWTPDGRSVTFTPWAGGGPFELWTARADRTGTPEVTLRLGRGLDEGVWSTDGEWLVGRTDNAATGAGDIIAVRIGVDSVAVPLAATGYREQAPSLSPDDRFLAFTSDESGRYEVVVTPFPNAGDWKIQVSADGGTEPVWGNTGRELFYRNAGGDMVSVEFTTNPGFVLGQEQVLFRGTGYRADPQHAQYDVSSDDERFLMIRSQDAGTFDMVFVGNFLEEVRAGVGG